MALKIHLVKRKVPAGEMAGREMFYGQVRLKEAVPLDKISRKVSADTTLTPSDVEAVLTALSWVVTNNLEGGNWVDLGDFGNMRLSAGSSGVEKWDDFHCRMMRRARVVFTAGKLLKDVATEVRYEWLPERIVEVPEECDKNHPL